MKLALFTIALLAPGVASASTTANSWYSSGFGGYTYLSSNVETRYYGFLLSDVHYRYGYNVGGSIGYQSNPIRYEFQYTYLYADTNQYSVNHKKALDIDGGTRANILMANLYYDFPEMLGEISPFLGVGIGYAFMHATLNSTSRFHRPHFNTDLNSFAYQGTAGLTYNFMENFAINAAYRYTATTNKGNWGRTLQAQMGNVGVVYRFFT
ncbi:opacity protein-like surface antigen [Legionella gratiana]|uniref:Opacity protein-like surface antigen n=1 Tax=Legionella gratiana TaxID=45066 RepID=A0A378JEM4_9GAMM|nr:outer membrane beta-barrel protein [Legionella gratiana]KTD12042.1 opacity protein-like surface antigen [Legionella gratiana]STX46354.1 opacity protein-like surface antigen [Legionella gratiana]